MQTFHTRQGRQKVDVEAVKGVDLDVAEGEIVAFLGPNGAGKTTTLRMLTTLLRPTSGTATVAGHDVTTDPVGVRRSIGYVSQSGSTSSVARAGEEVDRPRNALRHRPGRRPTRRGQELFEQLELDGLWDRQPKSMSGGQRRRLDIAMGLVHDPTLIFLDEPTTGLDPQARANLWEHIADLRDRRGATVFLTTHYLDEADALSDRIVVIDHGRIIAADTPDSLKAAGLRRPGRPRGWRTSTRRRSRRSSLDARGTVRDRRTARTRPGCPVPARWCRASCATSRPTGIALSTRSRSAVRPSTTSSSP